MTDLIEHIRSGGKVQTRDGRPVKVLSTEGAALFPIVGYVDGQVRPEVWQPNGGWEPWEGPRDLIPAPKKHVGWVNVYASSLPNAGPFILRTTLRSRADADRVACDNRIACIRVEFTEGQFDE